MDRETGESQEAAIRRGKNAETRKTQSGGGGETTGGETTGGETTGGDVTGGDESQFNGWDCYAMNTGSALYQVTANLFG